jgi:hypothetical protein
MPRSVLERLVYQVVPDHLLHFPAGGFATPSPAPGMSSEQFERELKCPVYKEQASGAADRVAAVLETRTFSAGSAGSCAKVGTADFALRRIIASTPSG